MIFFVKLTIINRDFYIYCSKNNLVHEFRNEHAGNQGSFLIYGQGVDSANNKHHMVCDDPGTPGPEYCIDQDHTLSNHQVFAPSYLHHKILC